MSDRRSTQGFFFLIMGLGILAWDWLWNRSTGWGLPSGVLATIGAPAVALMGLRMLLAPQTADPERDTDVWLVLALLLGVLLGIVNAYFLGVWRAVSAEGLREFAPLLIIVGLVIGIMAVRQMRAKGS